MNIKTRETRFDCRVKANISFQGKTLECVISNISTGGIACLLSFKGFLQIGQCVNIFAIDTSLPLANVRWIEACERGYRIGLEFNKPIMHSVVTQFKETYEE